MYIHVDRRPLVTCRCCARMLSFSRLYQTKSCPYPAALFFFYFLIAVDSFLERWRTHARRSTRLDLSLGVLSMPTLSFAPKNKMENTIIFLFLASHEMMHLFHVI